MNDDLVLRLKDVNLTFAQRFKTAAMNKLIIWPRKDKPNLSESEFKKVIRFMRADTTPQWKPRESQAGPHGLTGEDDCFVFRLEVTGIGKKETFYIKGFFFDKGNCIGVAIQSARRIRLNIQSPRI